jgi:hypothetical protein
LEGIREALENDDSKLDNDEDPAKKMSLIIALDSNAHLTRFGSSKPDSM